MKFIIYRRIGITKRSRKFNGLYQLSDYLWEKITYHKEHEEEFHYEVCINKNLESNPIPTVTMIFFIDKNNNFNFLDKYDLINFIESKIYDN